MEEGSVGPVNVDGASKLVGEFLVRQAAKRWLHLRISSVFGKMGSAKKEAILLRPFSPKRSTAPHSRLLTISGYRRPYTIDARSLEELIRLSVGVIPRAQ